MEVLTPRTTHIEFDVAEVKVINGGHCLVSGIRNQIIPGVNMHEAWNKKYGEAWEFAKTFSIKGVDERPIALLYNPDTGERIAFWYKGYHFCAVAA